MQLFNSKIHFGRNVARRAKEDEDGWIGEQWDRFHLWATTFERDDTGKCLQWQNDGNDEGHLIINNVHIVLLNN